MSKFSPPAVVRQSPKGLLTNTAGDPATIPGFQQLVVEAISSWRGWAGGRIEASGKDPEDYHQLAKSDVLDRACAAAHVLRQLDRIEKSLQQLANEPVSALAYQTLLLASLVHQATIVDNESGISFDEKREQSRNARLAERKAETEAAHRRIQQQAEEIWTRHPKLTKTAVADRIKNKKGLSPSRIRRVIPRPK